MKRMDQRRRGGKDKKKHRNKASEPALNNIRKLSRHGKKIKKGILGPTSWYISRNAALRKLQVNLKDFRRLCILKGIYPREPDNVPSQMKNKTYYHMKDIKYLSHEPLLHKFRSIKAFMSKVRNQLGRRNLEEANRLYEKRPIYSLDHLILERYPTFHDALEDLDDAFSLINLFANLPCYNVANSDWLNIPAETTEKCCLLAKQWQLYVTKSNSLRKVFISVKGIYFQANVDGVDVTWIKPHKFAQNMPAEVDFRVMNTFLEFYMSLVSFVLYKLYYNVGLKYPPTLNIEKDEKGDYLDALNVQNIENYQTKDKNMIENEEKTTDKIEKVNDFTDLVQNVEEDEEINENDEDEESIFEGDETKQQIMKANEKLKVFKNLFNGFKFYISREVPFEIVEFSILSFGGVVVRKPKSCTHFISDRQLKSSTKLESCEYVQPQWIFDSINSRFLLPVSKYKTDLDELPPHLSPFIDDEQIGYVPEYRTKIDSLKAAATSSKDIYKEIKLDTESKEEIIEEKDSDDSSEEDEASESENESEDDEEEEKVPAKKKVIKERVQKTKTNSNEKGFIKSKKYTGNKEDYIFRMGGNGVGYYLDEFKDRQVEFKRKKPMSNRERKRKEKEAMASMGKIVMKKKAKRLYDKMQYGINKKKEAVTNLRRKSERLQKQKKQKVHK